MVECDILLGGMLCCLVEIIDILEEYVPIFEPEEGSLLWQGILMVLVCSFYFNTKNFVYRKPEI